MFDLSKPLHLLYAWGNTISGSGYPGYHGRDGGAKYTDGTVVIAPASVVCCQYFFLDVFLPNSVSCIQLFLNFYLSS